MTPIVKKAVAKDEEEFLKKEFADGMDSVKAWRTAYELLGTVKNLSPTAIVHQEDGEDSPDLITNPLKMATIFNKFFRNRITTLREKTATEATIEPVTRLRNWLSKRLIQTETNSATNRRFSTALGKPIN